jgi:ankyrin repeat protein
VADNLLPSILDDLVIHCAVLASPSPHANELLDYLIQTCPSALEKKSSNGDTPLLVAGRLGRTQFVKILLGGNADQSARNAKGENILHKILAGNPSAHRLRPLLESLDPDLRAHLFSQRKNLSENGTAPLQAWVAQVCGAGKPMATRNSYYAYGWEPLPYEKREDDVLDVLKLLLEFSNEGKGLDMLNGAGDTCLHTAIMHHQVTIAKALIDFKPSLLYRENAVGRTPAEVAYDTLTSAQLAKPENITTERGDSIGHLAKRAANEFAADAVVKALVPSEVKAQLEGLGLSGDYSAEELTAIHGSTGLAGKKVVRRAKDALAKQAIWDFCYTAMKNHSGTRRLVSLNEANDVARRLGEQETNSRYFSVQTRKDEYEDEEDKEDKEDKDEKDDKDIDDFAAKELSSRLNSAWRAVSNDEYAEEMGLEKCDVCALYHE